MGGQGRRAPLHRTIICLAFFFLSSSGKANSVLWTFSGEGNKETDSQQLLPVKLVFRYSQHWLFLPAEWTRRQRKISCKNPRKIHSASLESCSIGFVLKTGCPFSKICIFKVNLGSQVAKISHGERLIPSACCKPTLGSLIKLKRSSRSWFKQSSYLRYTTSYSQQPSDFIWHEKKVLSTSKCISLPRR